MVVHSINVHVVSGNLFSFSCKVIAKAFTGVGDCYFSADEIEITQEIEVDGAMDVDFHVMALAADGSSDIVVPGDVVDAVLDESGDEISAEIEKTVHSFTRISTPPSVFHVGLEKPVHT